MVNYSNDELRWIIVYATSRLFASTLAVEQNPDGGTKFHCRVPHVLIENATSSALRLNNIDYSFADLYPVAAPQTPLSPIQLIHQRAQSLCDLWARLPRLFLSSYFHLIEAVAEEHRVELEERLEGYGGFYQYRDWMLSAFAPLPRAWLHVPEEVTMPPSQNTFIPIDFVFWTGEKLVAIFMVGTATLTKIQRKYAHRLRENGVDVCYIPACAVRRLDQTALKEYLPPSLLSYWIGEPFPSGPYDVPLQIENRTHDADP